MRSEQPLATMPITQLKGVGAKVAEKLAKINLVTVQDVLFHLPARYEDRTRIYPIGDCLPFTHVSILGEVKSADIQYGKKRMLVVKLSDGTGTITLRFFHFGALQRTLMSPGNQIRAFGEVRTGKWGLEMMHPEFMLIEEDAAPMEETLTPVYPTTEGVKQLTLRNLTDQALEILNKGGLTDLLPDGMYQQQVSLKEALTLVHRPPPDVALQELENGEHPAQMRLILEELLAQHLSVLKVRQQSDAQPGIAINVDHGLVNKLLAALPFEPTGAQQRVTTDIQQDMARSRPMMRLVQGDVGSGKTLVAALAALSAIGGGYQVALMAPTELLAEQHANNFRDWLAPLGIEVGWLAGKLKGKQRTEVLERLASGEVQMLVGTHAIFQEQVTYDQLALVIVDEQHRFGVHQRLALREKGEQQGRFPHQLIMTATPIPRTLAWSRYGALEPCTLRERAGTSAEVSTEALPLSDWPEVATSLRPGLAAGERLFLVLPRIDGSEGLLAETERLRTGAWKGIPMAVVHGRLPGAETAARVEAFASGDATVLAGTTVVEVGLDVPGVPTMAVVGAQRLGLASLHQLRGRLSRGKGAPPGRFLVFSEPSALERLRLLEDHRDGFQVAELDFQLRGSGSLRGTRQHGRTDFQLFRPREDGDLVELLAWDKVRNWLTAAD